MQNNTSTKLMFILATSNGTTVKRLHKETGRVTDKRVEIALDKNCINDCFIEVRCLSVITEIELLKLAKIVTPESFGINTKDCKVERRRDRISIINKDRSVSVDVFVSGYISLSKNDSYVHIPNMASGIDYLRRKRFAIPYLGLSIEELEKREWIKIVK